MKTVRSVGTWIAVVAVAAGCAQAQGEKERQQQAAPAASSAAPLEINPRLLRRFKPIAPAAPESAARVQLGRQLFHDPRLSLDKEVSCASCHSMDSFGVDGKKASSGHRGAIGSRNAPTVLNASLAFSQFWDGRAASIEDQAKGPILNAAEMAMPNGEAVVARIEGVPGYKEPFHEAFPEDPKPITFDNVARAIGAYERQLITPSRWDDFLRGDMNALTAKEKLGCKTFLNSGCMVCHTGPLLGGTTFERVGVVEPWPNQTDTGRMAVTHANVDRMMFKVPTLRNVAKTGPYFHDGSASDLGEAVRLMGRHQLGLELSGEEVESITAWLGALTGSAPTDLGPPPALPR